MEKVNGCSKGISLGNILKFFYEKKKLTFLPLFFFIFIFYISYKTNIKFFFLNSSLTNFLKALINMTHKIYIRPTQILTITTVPHLCV